MGQQISKIMSFLFDYPVKMKPICYHKPEDFTPTGELKPSPPVTQKDASEYGKLKDLFYERLAEQRHREHENLERDPHWREKRAAEPYPGWNEGTLANLHSLYLLFSNRGNGMLCFDDYDKIFCLHCSSAAILENLGDENAMDLRKQKFEEADSDEDGWIGYNQFIVSVYGFNGSMAEGALGTMAQLCRDAADNIEFINSLTLGEQLQYGLF